MEANIKFNSISKNSYNNLSFWENEIIKDNNLWEGYFDNKNITENSKIIYTGILDLNKNILQCGWAVYPCTHSLLGFLQYVYLPTAFFIWFDTKSDNSSKFRTVNNNFAKLNHSDVNLNSVNLMKNDYNFLIDLWTNDDKSLSLKLNDFCDSFNNNWDNAPNKRLFLKLFHNPNNTYDFIKNALIYDTKDFVDEDISATLDSLKFACDNAIEEPLINRRFIDILNTNAPILF